MEDEQLVQLLSQIAEDPETGAEEMLHYLSLDRALLIRDHGPNSITEGFPIDWEGAEIRTINTLAAYKRRLQDWRDEAETNKHGVAKYPDRAIKRLSAQIEQMERPNGHV